MNKNKKMVTDFFKKIYGLKVRSIRKGYGSFIFIDFGKEINYQSITKGNIEIKKRGEWQLWIQMCSWRIDEQEMPVAGCEDSNETIEKVLKKIENKKLLKVEVLNSSYDMRIEFEKSIVFLLFSIYTEKESESEHWILFTPDLKALTGGPGTMLEYEDSGEIPTDNKNRT